MLRIMLAAMLILAPLSTQAQYLNDQDSYLNKVVLSGDRSTQKVVEIQRLLTELGYKPGPVDGIYGGKTRRAIRAWQVKTGRPSSDVSKKRKRMYSGK